MASVAPYDDGDVRRAFVRAADVRGDHRHSLSSLIEGEIIPRLLAVHPIAPSRGDAGAASIDSLEIAELVPLTLHVEADALLAHVEAVLARGVSVEALMVDLLAPAARRLGEYWEEDRCDFVDVTMALWRLQQVVHEIAGRASDACGGGRGWRALFASMPGDQHDFGTVVIDEVFRRAGWRTDRLSAAGTPELLRRAGEDWLDLIGLTVSCDCHIAALPALLTGLRAVSRNPRLCIMVGGRIFSADPSLAVAVGADGTARDARLALAGATALVRARKEAALACC